MGTASEGGTAVELLAESGPEVRAETRIEAGTLGSAPPATADDSGGIRVTGRVVDTEGGAIAGAWLRTSEPVAGTLLESTADDQGRFELHVPLALLQRLPWIHVGAPGFVSDRRVLGLQPGDGALGDIVLRPGADVSGIVVDARGLGVEGALLLPGEPLVQPSGFALGELVVQAVPLARTGSGGRFKLEGQALGPLRVHVFHPRFATATVDTSVQVRGQTEWRIELEEGASLAGRVVELPASASFHVRAIPVGRDAEPRSVDVDQGGRFELAGLQAGAVYRCGLFQGELQGPRNEETARAADLDQPFGAPSSDTVDATSADGPIELVYTGLTRVSLHAVSAGDGATLDELSAYLQMGSVLVELSPHREAETAAAGRFEFGLGEAYPDDFGGQGPEAMFVHPDYLEHRVRLPSQRPIGELDLGQVIFEPAPRVSVRVTDAVTGVALPSAEVRLRYGDSVEPPARATNRDGTVNFPVQAGRSFDLFVRRGGFAPAQIRELRHAGDEDLDVPIQMTRGSILEVAVLESGGSPSPGARVVLYGEDPLEMEPLVGNEGPGGVHVVSYLPAGRYRVTASREDWPAKESESPPVYVDLNGSETKRIQVQLPPSSILSGSVFLGPEPLASASIELRVLDPEDPARLFGARFEATTDAGGRFEMTVPVPGAEVELTVRHSDLAAPYREFLRVVSAYTPVEIRIPNARLTGRVRDGRGRPVGGALVRVLVPDRRTPDRFELEGSGSQVLVVGGKRALADEQGRFELEGLPAGVEFHVQARPPQRLPNLTLARSETLELAPDESYEGLELVLLEGGTLWIEPEDASGQPVVACFVIATAPSGVSEQERRAYVGSEGRLELLALAPGTWELRIQRLGSGESQNHSVEIFPGQTETLRPRFEH